MPDYVLTKDIALKTGQLPDRLTMVLPPHQAWMVVRQMLLQLEQGNRQVSIDLYGTVEKKEGR